jgi:hypothetical protein
MPWYDLGIRNPIEFPIDLRHDDEIGCEHDDSHLRHSGIEVSMGIFDLFASSQECDAAQQSGVPVLIFVVLGERNFIEMSALQKPSIELLVSKCFFC